MEILITILIIILAIGLPIGFTKLKAKNIINSESLMFTANLFKLSNQVINELNLKYETELDKITEIILLSLNYVYTMDNAENKEVLAINYCLDMCEKMNIIINENRIAIISNLIKLGLTDKSKK